MSLAHLLNLGAHIGAGSAALLIGFALLVQTKGTATHKRRGRMFLALMGVVCVSAALGLVAFRFVPVFAALTVLVAYQAFGGWRAARRKAAGPNGWDALSTAAGAWALLALWSAIHAVPAAGSSVVFATLGALAFVLAYDAARWAFPRGWHGVSWRYEHACKMVATVSGMLSALVGNVVRAWQPWSQLLPSALGLLVIVGWCWRICAQQRRLRVDGGEMA